MKVANKKFIHSLSFKSLRMSKLRNIIAVMAIALTAILFTSLFTIVMSILQIMEQSTFRQVGTYAHGEFKYLNEKQVDELKDDELIEEYGIRRLVGVPLEAPFNKNYTEISYCDANYAKWGFVEPTEGNLPAENTNEAAVDTKVMSLLGIKPELGTEFTLTFNVDGTNTSETFTLCGWWERDEAMMASNILIPNSLAEGILLELGTQCLDGMTGRYSLDIMLKSKIHIEEDILTILEHHGYQMGEIGQGEGYIPIGVNWAYISEQSYWDFGIAGAVAFILFIILLTGYLIIYNIFQISVTNDIRFYGMLKTIGTTKKQIKHIVFMQAMSLSMIGIPIGLLIGYGIGVNLVPSIVSVLDVSKLGVIVEPRIFVAAALFALVTVMISCIRPAKMAAKVSPIEALRYTENIRVKKTFRHGKTGASVVKMAWANLGKNRSKTVVTIISLSLAIVILNITVIFSNGFDMDKYLVRMTTDYVVGHVGYFDPFRFEEIDVPEKMISAIENQGGVIEGGRTYRQCSEAIEFVEEEYFRTKQARYYTEEEVERRIKTLEKDNGRIANGIQLFGMEDFCINQLNVYEGDISKLKQEGNYIAAVYDEAENGGIATESHWAKLGDKVKVRYITEEGTYTEIDYEVVALVDIPYALTYRYKGESDEFVLDAENFKRDTQTESIMYYAYNVEEEEKEHMETFLAQYTEETMPDYTYESKGTYEKEFNATKNMFVILGSVLSFIIGLVGVLNFFNAIVTGIYTRRREFAVLQSIGMTGKQLKRMLGMEGLFYSISAVMVSVTFSLVMSPLLEKMLSNMLWFFTYHFTVVPFLVITPIFILLGIGLPILSYQFVVKRSIVERLRETE